MEATTRGVEPLSLKAFGLVGNGKGVRHALGDDFVKEPSGHQRRERPSWIEVERVHHEGGGSDRTPGLQVSGQDWEERSKLRNGMSQSFTISSILAHWIDVGWGGGACRR